MAEEKKKRVRKSANSTKSKKSDSKNSAKKDNMAVLSKKKDSKRESDAKARAKAEQPKRVRKAADTAKKPVSATKDALTQQYHLTDPDKGGFFRKTRSLTPGYVRRSWEEVRQVTWPGRRDTWRMVFAVFVFAIIMGAGIAVVDYVLERVMREIIL